MNSITKTNFSDSENNKILLIKKGVVLVNPSTIFIGNEVNIEPGVIIYPNVTIYDNVTIKANTTIQSCTMITNNTIVNENCLIGTNTIIREDVSIGKDSIIGPHCEVVRSKIGVKCTIAHKNFIGDAIIFDNVKFGCGSIIANSDFKTRFKTIINEGVSIGVNANLIAPITIGKNSFVAAGSTIVNDIPENNLAIARSFQTNKVLK